MKHLSDIVWLISEPSAKSMWSTASPVRPMRYSVEFDPTTLMCAAKQEHHESYK